MNLILIHNHPGGNPSPSVCDREITERISQAGEMLGICLLDHIIIGDERIRKFQRTGIVGRISGMKGLFYAFKKNIRNRSGKQQH